MSALTHPADANLASDQWTPQKSMGAAWGVWLALFCLPVLVMVWTMATLDPSENRGDAQTRWSNIWFVGSCIWLGVTIPLSFFVRGRLFKNWQKGETVPPGKYLLGMLVPWVCFEIAGIGAILGIHFTNLVMPCILPAMAAFVVFLTQWPNGHAMTRHVGGTDDGAFYEEPR